MLATLAMWTLPIFPDWTYSTKRWVMGRLRLWVPTCTTRLVRRTASTSRRPSRTLWDSGFST